MERSVFKIGLLLVTIVVILQVFVFYEEYEKFDYAPHTGVLMKEDTYLYVYDELTIESLGEVLLEDLVIYKNGEIIARGLNMTRTLTVKEKDLIEISLDKKHFSNDEQGIVSVEIRLSLRDKLFNEKFYVDCFDYSGGRVTIGRFIEQE